MESGTTILASIQGFYIVAFRVQDLGSMLSDLGLCAWAEPLRLGMSSLGLTLNPKPYRAQDLRFGCFGFGAAGAGTRVQSFRPSNKVDGLLEASTGGLA